MPLTSLIGGTFAISVATPSTIDASGFAALTWTLVGEVTSHGPLKDTSDMQEVALLATGRKDRINTVRAVDEIPVAMFYSKTDAGQILVRANANTNTYISCRFTNADGHISYVGSVLANREVTEATADGYKGMATVVRAKTALIEVSA